MASLAYCRKGSASFMAVPRLGVLLTTQLLLTGGGCLCKNAHSATRRDCRIGLSFFVRNARHATNRVLGELSPTNGPGPRNGETFNA
jgi:hypothetical protein